MRARAIALVDHRQTWLKIGWGLTALLMMAYAATAQGAKRKPAGPPPTPQFENATHVVMKKVDAGSITVDGDLADWGDLSAGYMDQALDWVKGPMGQRDAAAYKIARDDKALYIAVRVIDSSLFNPYPDERGNLGDSVELFLDVRQVRGDGPVLHDRKYTAGVYHLLLMPAFGERKNAQVVEMAPVGKPLMRTEIQGRQVADGYTLEIRIPYTSFPAALPERFEQAIGVGVQVNDADLSGLDAGTPPVSSYCWGGVGTMDRDGSTLAVADANEPADAGNVIRVVVPRVIGPDATGGRTLVLSGVIRRGNNVPGTVDQTSLFSSNAFDQGAANGGAAEGQGRTPRVSEFQIPPARDAAFGVTVQSTCSVVEPPISGRYVFTANFTDNQPAPALSRFYAMDNGQGQVRLWPVDARVADLMPFQAMSLSPMQIRLATSYVQDESVVKGNAELYLPPSVAWALSKAQDANASVLNTLLRVELVETRNLEVIWRQSLPVEAAKLRESIPFVIPAKNLAEGTFMVRTVAVAPDGTTIPIVVRLLDDPENPVPVETSLRVMRHGNATLVSNLVDAPQLATNAIELGTPNRLRYSQDDARDCIARSVWSMRSIGGRVLVGVGDWQREEGPVDVFSFGPGTGLLAEASSAGAAITAGAKPAAVDFRKEFLADDAAIERFRQAGDLVIVPGTESRVDHASGNLYVQRQGRWQKKSTVPEATHMVDAAVWRGNWYISTGTTRGAAVYESTDQGTSWHRLWMPAVEAASEGRFGEMAAMNDSLLIFPTDCDKGVYQFDGSRLSRLQIPVLPGLERYVSLDDTRPGRVERVTRMGNSVLYTPTSEGQAKPLIVLSDLEQGAVIPTGFQNKRVRDILVRDKMAHVLTSERVGNKYETEIYRSTDLVNWLRVAAVEMPAMAMSLENVDGAYYVGLGATEADPRNAASGSIWRLEVPASVVATTGNE